MSVDAELILSCITGAFEIGVVSLQYRHDRACGR